MFLFPLRESTSRCLTVGGGTEQGQGDMRGQKGSGHQPPQFPLGHLLPTPPLQCDKWQEAYLSGTVT